LIRGLRTVPDSSFPLFTALVAAVAVMAFHEVFDFNLRTPANALLLVAILALALRLAGIRPATTSTATRCDSYGRYVPQAIAVLALIGAFAATRQGMTPYPYSVTAPRTLAHARALIRSHPGRADGHLAMARLADEAIPTAFTIAELGRAVWLAPTNPYARDEYAGALMRAAKPAQALGEIERAVALAPVPQWHPYLDWRLTPWLSPAEQSAVERGFKTAIVNGYEGAVEGLGGFYGTLGRLGAEAALYRSAAATTHEPGRRMRYLIYAGDAYSQLHQGAEAETMFLSAASAAPADAAPYQYLIQKVYVPTGDFAAAKTVMARAIGAGAPPFPLYQALGAAAHLRGNDNEAEEALNTALEFRPNDFAVISQLGRVYLAQNRFDRAAFWLAKAVNLKPRSVEALCDLASAEEGAYDYFAARHDYERAIALSPDDSNLRARYQSFRSKAESFGVAPGE